MRRVKIDSIVYYSNQHPEYPASNLLDLGLGDYKKWLCTQGEPFCSVVLQLERVVKISAVHVGTCMAGLVELQVGHSETPTVPCEVLLPRIEFTCYTAQRCSRDGEQQASFKTGELLRKTREKRWDRVRVVCSRPFESCYKYGLNFIEIFEDVDMNQPELVRALGPALPSRMLKDVPAPALDEDHFRPAPRRTSDGARRNNPGAQRPQAASQVVKKVRSVKKVGKKRTKKSSYSRKKTKSTTNSNRQKETPMHTDDNEQPHTKSHVDGKDQEKKKEEPPKKDEQEPSTSKSFSEHSGDNEQKTLNNSGSKDSSKDDKNENTKDLNTSGGKKDSKDEKKKKDEERAPTQKKGDDSKQNKDQTAKSNSRKRPHSDEQQKGKAVRASQRRLLGAVVFAVGGYSPARRARLRAAAEAMGARFQAHWSPRCTHLVCASSNAPELKTARASKASCIAVHGEWVERCSARRRRLPWQWFATERAHKLARPPAEDREMEERRDASG